jgi:hypothetical protein
LLRVDVEEVRERLSLEESAVPVDGQQGRATRPVNGLVSKASVQYPVLCCWIWGTREAGLLLFGRRSNSSRENGIGGRGGGGGRRGGIEPILLRAPPLLRPSALLILFTAFFFSSAGAHQSGWDTSGLQLRGWREVAQNGSCSQVRECFFLEAN